MNRAEERYIIKRKIKAFGNRLCFYLCRIFPIKKNLISVCTFEGKGGFGCNPKYIVQELHKRNADYQFVWFVNDMTKEFPDYIKKVPNTLWSRAYWLSRSKVWIDNYRKPYGTCKRKGQYYLNTNHYTLGIKTVGLWRREGFSHMAYLVSKNDSDMIDDLIIDSDFCEEMCPKGLIYEGHLLKTGAPRCDVLFGDRSIYKKNFCEKHHLPEDAKVVMYAPTFREGSKNGKRSVFSEVWTIDFKKLLSSLEKRFGGEWYLCVRVHPQLAATFDDYHNSDLGNRIINESKADDMYEILAGMDAYITDYSSACFEAAFARIPVFIYADDIAKYTYERGALFWNIQEDGKGKMPCNPDIFKKLKVEFPFSVAVDNNQLEKDIIGFSSQNYQKRLDAFFSGINHCFNGVASARVASIISEKMGI